jgi:hypothetical protein
MLVILHGWSDDADSFQPLARWLAAEGIARDLRQIRLGDYLTLDDDVTFADLSQALDRAWSDAGLSERGRSVDVVVHSTGGLVIRDWMVRRASQGRANPVRRLLMLAPANFGSPLAHTGRSLLGRVVRGFGAERRFHTGKHILKGLELASPYALELARRDLFGRSAVYGRGKVLCTVLVGTAGYGGIRAVANKPGSDGTVLVSSANLDAAQLTLDFATDPRNPSYALRSARGQTAFARLPGHNHGSITLRDEVSPGALTDFIRRALTVTDAGFAEHCGALAAFSQSQEPTGRHDRRYQNTVVHVADDHGRDVDDFFLELYMKRRPRSRGEWEEPTTRIQEDVIAKVHVYGDNAAYRSLLVDCQALTGLFDVYPGTLCLSLAAYPEIGETGSVGYRTLAWNALDSVKLTDTDAARIFTGDRTLLVSLKLRREQEPGVFRLRRA